MDKNIPKRRFKEFEESGEWQKKKLGHISDIRTGSSDLKDSEKDGKYPFFVRSKVIERSNRYIFDGEAILIPGEGKLGDIYHYIEGKFDYHQRVYKISDFKYYSVNGKFVYYNLRKNFKKHALKYTVKATVDSLRLPMLTGFELLVPSIEEQEKIGDFFLKLDKLIDINRKKRDKLKNSKSAYLEEMFPKEGEVYPRRRFEGFTNPWEEKKLGEVADRYDNLRIPVTESKRKLGITPYYGANGIVDYIDGFTHEGEFVLLAEDGANDLNNYPIHYVNGKVWVNNHAHVIQGIDKILKNIFLVYRLKTIDISSYLVGGSRAKLNADTMMQLNISIPSLEEQEKIGEFFKKLDEQIELQERKIEKLENMKKAYLAEMFV